MIDLYYWTTPNGHKITIFLEETGYPYRIIPIDIRTGRQFDEDFLKISPNNKIPAIVDHDTTQGKEAFPVFESGAILIYLAEKTGEFIPSDAHARSKVIQWLMWQMGGLGPMLGQNHHFSHYAPEQIPYAIDRYRKETERLYGVLDDQLETNEFVSGDYSIADMAIYPWIVPYEKQGQNLDDFPNLMRWFRQIEKRPAVQRAYRKADEINTDRTMNEASKAILFGQQRRRKEGET